MTRKTIHIPDIAAPIIGEVENLSGRITSIVVRYGTIVKSECPALSEPEWMLICDMLNATVIDADHRDTDPARYLWADIAEAGQLDGLAGKWAVDTEALSQRVRDMRLVEQIAIVEVVAKFWRHPKLNELPPADLLAEAGAKVKAG